MLACGFWGGKREGGAYFAIFAVELGGGFEGLLLWRRRKWVCNNVLKVEIREMIMPRRQRSARTPDRASGERRPSVDLGDSRNYYVSLSRVTNSLST